MNYARERPGLTLSDDECQRCAPYCGAVCAIAAVTARAPVTRARLPTQVDRTPGSKKAPRQPIGEFDIEPAQLVRTAGNAYIPDIVGLARCGAWDD